MCGSCMMIDCSLLNIESAEQPVLVAIYSVTDRWLLGNKNILMILMIYSWYWHNEFNGQSVYIKCDIVTWQFPDFLCYYSVFITGMNSIIQQYTEKADSRSTTPQFCLHNQSMVTNKTICNHQFENTKFCSTFWL